MGIKRYDKSEAQWRRNEAMLPDKTSDLGRTTQDNRLFINGVCGFCDPVQGGRTCLSAMASTRPCTNAVTGRIALRIPHSSRLVPLQAPYSFRQRL